MGRQGGFDGKGVDEDGEFVRMCVGEGGGG